MQIESPRAEERHVAREHPAKLDRLARLDQPRSAQHGLRAHMVGRAALVVRAPLRWTTLRRRRRLPRLCERAKRQQQRTGQAQYR
jgi:hypothetical protein